MLSSIEWHKEIPPFSDKPYIATAAGPHCTGLDGGGRRCWCAKQGQLNTQPEIARSARVSIQNWHLKVPAWKCRISFCLLRSDRLHQLCQVWSTASLQVWRIPSWGSVPCPTLPCSFGQCCVDRVGELQYLFDVHYLVWCHCVKDRNSIILLSNKTGESIAIPRVLKMYWCAEEETEI